MWSGSNGGRSCRAKPKVEGARVTGQKQVDPDGKRKWTTWLCEQAKGSKVLCLGDCRGHVPVLLSRLGFEVQVLSLRESILEGVRDQLAREVAAVRARVALGHWDGGALPHEDGVFDTVILDGALADVEQPAHLVQETGRVLASWGKVAIVVPFGHTAERDRLRSFFPLELVRLVRTYMDVESMDVLLDSIRLSAVPTDPQRYSWDDQAASRKILVQLESIMRLEQDNHPETSSLQREIASLDTRIEDARKRRDRLEAQRDALARQTEALRSEVGRMRREADKLRGNIESLQVSPAPGEGKEPDADRANAGTIEAAKEHHGRLLLKLEQAIDQRRRAEDDRARCQVEVDRLGARASELEDELDDVIAELDRADIAPGELSNRLEELVDQWENLREQHRQVSTDVRWRVGDLLVRAARRAEKAWRLPSSLLGRRRGKQTGTSARSTQPRRTGPSGLRSKHAIRPRVAAVLDDFSRVCMEPDCDLLLVSPDDHERVIRAQRPDLLLVESAFHGNNGAWSRQVERTLLHGGRALPSLVRACTRQGVPTVFWNKDDPAHFERFLPRAGLFDAVFTSDADCVPRYKKAIDHDRVHVLPFAAQPVLHNPVSEEERLHPVCFAGSYWGDRYPQRRKDMQNLLAPAMIFGLHIYDRNLGRTGLLARKWRFPAVYQSAIRGRLSYEQVVRAYRRYRVFLNVNSITDSPTMFPRRVFELLACGTPVISSYARGIEEVLGEGAVLFSGSESETRQHLLRLLDDGDFWARRSVQGIRRVMRAHCLADRLEQLLGHVGLPAQRVPAPSVAVLAHCQSEADIRQLSGHVARQTMRPALLVVLVARELGEDVVRQTCRIPDGVELEVVPASLRHDPGRLLELVQARADWLAIMSPADHYGIHHLEDLLLATRYSDAHVLGRVTHHRRAGDKWELVDPGREFRRVEGVLAATAAVRVDSVGANDVRGLLEEERYAPEALKCLSLDRFGYAPGAAREPEEVLALLDA